ncbi:ChbG/HpnK family deacetylase [bacterium]|nr:ChbG/HpnK family deacetylase [bacterium]
MKKLIFNADDFGNSTALNQGIRKGAITKVINSTSLMATGPAFEDAVFNILPEIQYIDLGVHLNIIEGQSLTNPTLICNKNGKFNKDFMALQQLSQKPEVLQQIEIEFRAQIEKILKYSNVTHIDSHVHTHAITPIFELTCKLAKEYGIERVRTQYEVPYISSLSKIFNIKYPINLIKRKILNDYTKVNRRIIEKYELTTNKYFVGVTFTGYMDENAVWYGLMAISDLDCTAEVLIHPHYYKKGEKILTPNNYKEYLITQSKTIKSKIAQSGWEYQ